MHAARWTWRPADLGGSWPKGTVPGRLFFRRTGVSLKNWYRYTKSLYRTDFGGFEIDVFRGKILPVRNRLNSVTIYWYFLRKNRFFGTGTVTVPESKISLHESISRVPERLNFVDRFDFMYRVHI